MDGLTYVHGTVHGTIRRPSRPASHLFPLDHPSIHGRGPPVDLDSNKTPSTGTRKKSARKPHCQKTPKSFTARKPPENACKRTTWYSSSGDRLPRNTQRVGLAPTLVKPRSGVRSQAAAVSPSFTATGKPDLEHARRGASA